MIIHRVILISLLIISALFGGCAEESPQIAKHRAEHLLYKSKVQLAQLHWLGRFDNSYVAVPEDFILSDELMNVANTPPNEIDDLVIQIEKDLNTSIQLDPSLSECYFQLVVSSILLANTENAIKYASILLEKNPAREIVYPILAALFAEKQEYEEILALLKKQIQNNPEGIKNEWGLWLKTLGIARQSETILLLGETLKTLGNPGEGFLCEGLGELIRGNLHLSDKAFSKALNLEPEYRKTVNEWKLELSQE